jgi:hypothetical protein
MTSNAVRQLGLSLFLICNKSRESPQVLEKMIAMAYKTAKAHLGTYSRI